MRRNRLRVSIVIPAYNEESHLRSCLDAIAGQTVAPFEVIVVDNNSSDATAVVAASYPFVRVLREPRQGVAYARDCGFDAARGEIIGRIDVDTILSSSWVADIEAIFAGQDIDAISGSLSFTDAPFAPFFMRIDGFFRRHLARSLASRGELFLYGGNMALKRSAWRAVREHVCHERRFHEDIDLAAHFAHTGLKVGFDEQLRAGVSARRIDSPPQDFYPYVMRSGQTYAAHGLKGRFYMYPVELLVVAVHAPLRLLYRSYDPAQREFSLGRMLRSPRPARVSPVSDAL